MDGLKKIGRFIRNCVELYIPIAAFVALFLIFCFQVFMRYVANNPQSWTLEVEQMCFLWLVLLGACFAQREKAHVSFTLLYDMLGVKGKALTAMLGNLLIAVTFAVAFIPSLRYIWGLMSRAQVTSILKIPKTLVFFPYVIFLGFILVYSLLDIYEEIRVLQGDQRYINKMLNEGKSEAEQAVEDAIQQENGEAKKEEQ
ncbi:TRAP transporter small permease [Oscillibacter sp.]|uniref:TRAP transporter small permease n=1 Tax=Oscillibacter sp. TaxID=1945593 RepID=UPI00289A3FFC|nr:TRAP transporter small permease [Oscillibacter sp.]